MTARVIFVAGAHTEIGKTHVACGLLRAARARGLSVDALKPVVSGFEPGDWTGSDPGRLLAAMGKPLNEESLDAISPWRLAAPLAPPMAAELEGQALPIGPVIDFCRRRIAASDADLVLVEGVGGLMSPICDDATSLDLLEGVEAPSVLVSGAYLGAVSHALTALEVMRLRRRPPAALLVSEDVGPEAPDFPGTVALLARHAGALSVIPVPREAGGDWAERALDAG